MRRHWAGGTDRLLAGRRFTCLFSDLDVPAASVIADAMAELAAAGSHTRLALTPRRDRRIWSADRQCPIAVHELPDSVARDAPSAVLEYVRRLPGPRQPLTAHTSPRQLVLDLDHGLGDGRFAVDLDIGVVRPVPGRQHAVGIAGRYAAGVAPGVISRLCPPSGSGGGGLAAGGGDTIAAGRGIRTHRAVVTVIRGRPYASGRRGRACGQSVVPRAR